MISRNIFGEYRSPSINELSPIHNNNFAINKFNDPMKYSNQKSHDSQSKYKYSNEKRNFSTEKQRYSNEKYPHQHETQNDLNQKYGLISRNLTEQKNSLLLKSYDKYDISNKSKHDKVIEESHNDSQNSPVFHTEINSHQKPYLYENKSPQLNQSRPLLASSLPSEYELLLQYELKREQEKNEILQKRLSNKEQFILEMKKIQEDLTIAYAKCQQDLNNANTLNYEMQTKGTKEIRDYKEEIQELKHQILILHKELQENKQTQLKPSSSKKSIKHFNSIQNDKSQNQDKKYAKTKSLANLARHKSTGEVNFSNPPIPKKQSNPMNYFYDFNDTKKSQFFDEKPSNLKVKLQKREGENVMVRSHTQSVLSNVNKRRQDSSEMNKVSEINKKVTNTPLNSQFSSVSNPIKQESNLLNTFKPLQGVQLQLSEFETEIVSNLSKVANFLHHFIDMCEKMQEINEQRQKSRGKENPQKNKLIHELKKYWKWIKNVIRQWKQMKDEKESNNQNHKHFGGISNFIKKQKGEQNKNDAKAISSRNQPSQEHSKREEEDQNFKQERQGPQEGQLTE